MPAHQKNIYLTLIYKGESYPVSTYHDEYYTLMSLISKHLALTGFGLCSGMGSCGTCTVQISTPNSTVTRRLQACNVEITDELSNTQITIPEWRC